MSNTVSVTESNNAVTVTPSSNKITVTESNPSISVATPFSKVGSSQNAFVFITDGSNTAEADSSTDTFTVSATAPITATVNAGADSLTIAASVDTDLTSVSGSDDTVASAKAIKTYVDAQVTAQDLDFATDSGSGAVDLDSQSLTIQGGEGVDVTHSNQTVTVAGEIATSSNKGVASFSDADFGNVSGAVNVKPSYVQTTGTIASSGTADITNITTTNINAGDLIVGPNLPATNHGTSNPLTVYQINVAGSSNNGTIAVGGNSTGGTGSGTYTFYRSGTVTKDISKRIVDLDADLSSTSGSDDTIPSAKATKAYVDGAASQATTAAQGVGTGDSPTFVNTTLTGDLKGPATFTIDPATVGDNTGTLVVAGNLQVDGTTTTVNSTTLTVDDKNIELGTVNTPSDTTADGGGITLKGATDKTILWDNANDNWTSSEHLNIATGKSFKVNNADVLNATTLGSSVVNSSLTTVAGGAVSTIADATALAIALG